MVSTVARRREAKMRAQAGLCHYCSQPMWSGDPTRFRAAYGLSKAGAHLFRCTAEHLKPRCEGGTDSLDNLVAACWFCNVTRHRRKRPLDPDAYRAMVRRRLQAGHWRRLPIAENRAVFSASF
jgi:5-methylcytosine-specific restriction endonuclease McrA